MPINDFMNCHMHRSGSEVPNIKYILLSYYCELYRATPDVSFLDVCTNYTVANYSHGDLS